MKKILLTKGKVALVDDADYEQLNQWKWHAIFLLNHDKCYAARASRESSSRQKTIYMHIEIMQPIGKLEIDHIDGDGLNNQRSNLREATRAQNGRNRKLSKNSTTGFKGVSFCKKDGRFWAWLTFNNRLHYLGRYKSPEEAAHAYDIKALELFGEFARLNFPRG